MKENTMQYQGHLRLCNVWQARLANLQEWAWVSLGAPFIWPCASSKPKKKKKKLVNYYNISNDNALKNFCVFFFTLKNIE